jgi:hypothetical protein
VSNAADGASRSTRADSSPADAKRAKAQGELVLMIGETIQSLLPASPGSPASERAARRIERRLRDYFKRLEVAVPEDRVEAIFYRNVGND